MRLLIDEDVHVKLIPWLTQKGHDAVRVPSGMTNGRVLDLAQRERRVLITRDKDFADRLRYPPGNYGGIVHLRIHPPLLEKLVASLQALLSDVPEHRFSKRLVVLEESGYRIFPDS
jgi:predicted nuclease of predicted toxin-antitoxin system